MANWHDINSPGFYQSPQEEPESATTDTEDTESQPQEQEEPEVRLISAEWKPGPEGFQYNKPCSLEVKGEYLKETIRARVKGKLWGVYDGEEVDLQQELEGWIKKDTGLAEMKLKYLWFVNDDHYNTWYNDKSTPADYIVKGIFHSLGENEIDSPVLKMPQQTECSLMVRLRIDPASEESQDDRFRLFSTDETRTYDTVLTVRDDKVPGDNLLDLRFTGLDKNLSYTLEINPGSEGKIYYGFKNKSYQELTRVS